MSLRQSLLAAALLGVFGFALAGCESDGLSTADKAKQVENHTELAQLYYSMGELDRAEGQTLKGLEYEPGNVRLKLIRAKIMEKRGRPEDFLRAEKLLREIENDADFQVRLLLGIALERKGIACDEAATAIEQGHRLTEAADPAQRVGELRGLATTAWREAVPYFERVLAEHKDDTDALNGLMRVHGLLGEKEQSLSYADRLLATTSTDLDFWQKQLTRPQMSVDEEARFRAFVKQYTQLQVATHVAASIVLHDLGRFPAAEAHVEKALDLDPDRAELYGRRAELRKQLGRFADAIEDIDVYLRLSTNTFDHPDVLRAWNLRRECEEALRQTAAKRTS